MAKPPTKKKQTKKKKVAIDPLAVGLSVLAETDKASARALRRASRSHRRDF